MVSLWGRQNVHRIKLFIKLFEFIYVPVISVYENYKLDDNGTFLGVFRCPLPFTPPSHA